MCVLVGSFIYAYYYTHVYVYNATDKCRIGVCKTISKGILSSSTHISSRGGGEIINTMTVNTFLDLKISVGEKDYAQTILKQTQHTVNEMCSLFV